MTPHSRLSPLLLLCPLLSVSDSIINALGLSIVALLVTVLASLPMSLALQRLPPHGRIAAVVAITAGVVTSALLLIHALFYDLYLAVGMYIPLLVSGALLISRFDVVTPREKRTTFILAGLRTGIAFCFALLTLGATREWVGHGSLLADAVALPGQLLDNADMQFFHPDLGFVLALLPPGAFIAMGILFAVRNWYVLRYRS
jgi:Na+-translocating ferredoxin:NAD+ oxidoreductase subunit E